MSNNQKYIIRTDRAGVFYAGIESRNGSEADLIDARRIWSWSGASECIQIAQEGVAASSRITMAAPTLTVLGVIEVHPVSEAAQKVLDGIKPWKA